MKQKRKNTAIIVSLLVIIAIISIGAVYFKNRSNSSSSSYQAQNSSLKAENQRLKKNTFAVSVVGSYQDKSDGAAIQFNKDKTGRYVYADPTDPNTDDTFTWQKISKNLYTLKLNDSNVTSDLKAKLEDGNLVLTGDSNWNEERFTKTKRALNLSNFLAEYNNKKGKVAQSNQEQSDNGNNQASGHPREKSLTEDGKTYTAHYDANGQVQSVSVTGSDGVPRLGGDPSPYWIQKEKEIDEYGH